MLLLAPAALTGRIGAAAVFAVAVWVSLTALEAREPGPIERPPPSERLRAVALLGTIWTTTLVALPLHPLAAALGTALALAGITLRLAAIRTLGEGFGAGLQPTVPLRNDGPYRYLHHPSELGLLLLTLGVVVTVGAPLAASFAWGALVVVPSLLRIRAEDHALLRSPR